MRLPFLASLLATTLILGACGNTVEQRIGGAAVGAGTGAVVAGPVGVVVGGAAGSRLRLQAASASNATSTKPTGSDRRCMAVFLRGSRECGERRRIRQVPAIRGSGPV